mgnify:CR=1 FL=1
MAEIIKVFRGIPRDAVEANIRRLENVRNMPDGLGGERWRVEFEKLEPVGLGSLTFGRLRFALRGEDDAVERVWRELSPGFLRGVGWAGESGGWAGESGV